MSEDAPIPGKAKAALAWQRVAGATVILVKKRTLQPDSAARRRGKGWHTISRGRLADCGEIRHDHDGLEHAIASVAMTNCNKPLDAIA